jgi:SAM-dependent methyltransferase
LHYEALEAINRRPDIWSAYTADTLWTDPHISAQMLACHLNPDIEAASRNHAFIDRSAAWIVETFHLDQGRRVADFGCGPGLYTTRFAAAGARVTGIDFSERSIRYARAQAAAAGLEIDYIVHDYLTYETDEVFDLITLIYCDLCALSPAQRSRLLTKFRSLLAEGGAILRDVHTLVPYAQLEESATYAYRLMGGFWAPGDYYGFANTFIYDEEKVVLDQYTLVEPDRTRTVYNLLQYYTPAALHDEFAANGLVIEVQYANVAGDPYREAAPEIAVVARKV